MLLSKYLKITKVEKRKKAKKNLNKNKKIIKKLRTYLNKIKKKNFKSYIIKYWQNKIENKIKNA